MHAQVDIGERYECLSCKQLKRSHNLCVACYESYPLKSKTLAETLDENGALENKTPTLGSKIHLEPEPVSSRSKCGTIEHVFRCISKPGTSGCNGRLYDQNTIDKTFKPKTVGDMQKKAAQFSELEFLVYGMLMYPIGLLSLLLNRLFVKRSSVDDPVNRHVDPGTAGTWCPLRWLLKHTQKWSQYFENLPWIAVGMCLLFNAAAVMGIIVYQSKNGYAATLYWIYVYQTFFVQSLIVQVQLFTLETDRYSTAIVVLSVISGSSFICQSTTFGVDSSYLHNFVPSSRDCTQSTVADLDSQQFVFLTPNINGNEDAPNTMLCTVDPKKASFVNPVSSNSYALTILVMVAFAFFITVISVFSIDTVMMIRLFGDQIRLPQMVTYDISHSTSLVSGCSDGDDAMARVLWALQLVPVPTSARGLPEISLQFMIADHTRTLNVSVEMFWYADLVNSSASSIELQLLENNDFIPFIISFPNTTCNSVPSISLHPTQSYPKLKGLEKIRARKDSPWMFLCFYFTIAGPAIVVSSCLRALFVCLNIAVTWEHWNVFNSFTDSSKPGGFWSTDHMARVQIDFSYVQNALAWYNLRKLLCEMTDINLHTAIPMLQFAVIQFVFALGAVCWYAVSGKAPIPGFAYLVFLCVNPLVVLMFVIPLTLIWRIQHSHIGILAQKTRHIESLAATLEPDRAQERQNAARVLAAIKAELEANDKRVAVLGFELSPGFFQTLATFAATGVSFLLGSKIQYHVTEI